MSKWNVYNFNDLIYDDTKNGTKIKKEDYLEQGLYPIIDQGQNLIAGYRNTDYGLYTDVPAIIFGDHTRAIKYVDTPFFLGADGVKLLKSKKDNIYYKYLYYFFLGNEVPNTGYNRHFKWLKEMVIPLPPLETQKQIAKTLDTAAELLTMRKQQLAELDNLIKSIFYDMFGDPISNDRRIKSVSLEELFENVRYGTSTPPVFSDKGYCFIRATNIKIGRIIDTDMKYISEDEAKKISKCKLQSGDFIIVRSGVNTGDTCVITEKYDGHYAGYDLIIKLKRTIINPIYLNELINTNYMEIVIKPLTRRAAQPHLNAEQLKKLEIILPSIELQNQFAEIVFKIEEQKSLVKNAIHENQYLFDSLMNEYFEQ